ncbi:hypothetical protein ACFRAE_16105 [Sphingobacterium sp. HJSM2_6]|uniref:hypothetical protein n=1 Tax=Sphingobacterium sp. HJSM2_6 TaxID=3366264 RepID=UPI003BE85A72
MNPTIWVLLLAIAIFLVYLYKQYQQKHSFAKKAELKVQVFLDQKLSEHSKHYGCIIFQLPKYHEQLKEVVITSVRSSDKSMRINNFDKLNFFIVPGRTIESAKRSIGFYISNASFNKNLTTSNDLLIKGYFISLDNTRTSFLKSSNYQMESMDASELNPIHRADKLSLQ